MVSKLQSLRQSKSSQPVQQSDGELGKLHLQVAITDALLTTIQKITGETRTEVAQRCKDFRFDELSLEYYNSLNEYLTSDQIDLVAGFIYSDLYKTYEAALSLVVQEKNESLMKIVEFLCLEKQTDIDVEETGDGHTNVVVFPVKHTLN